MIPKSMIERSTLGEIVAWEIPYGIKITLATMRSAIAAAGFEPTLAKEFSTKRAFNRACRKMKKDGLIRVFDETENTQSIRFQFTFERREGDEFKYDTVSILSMDRTTGIVTCDENIELAERATNLVAHCMDIRWTTDVTTFLKTLFKKKADLFPVRNAGGAYFVPAEHIGFVEGADKFLTELGGKISRFPVALGSGKKSVREAIEDGLAKVIQNHLDAVEKFDIAETRATTFANRATAIEHTRIKIEAYAAYLDERKDELLQQVEVLKDVLRDKIGKSELAKAA